MPQSSHRHVTVSAPCSAVGAVEDGPGDAAVSSWADVGAYPSSLSDDESYLSDDCENEGDGERNAGAGEYIVDRVGLGASSVERIFIFV